VLFNAFDPQGHPIYHTNVMLWIGTKVAGVCLEVLPKDQRSAVQRSLSAHHALIELTSAQVRHFAGNALEVQTIKGELLFVISEGAYDSLTPSQRAVLKAAYQNIIAVPFDGIHEGGGSVRCTLLECYFDPERVWEFFAAFQVYCLDSLDFDVMGRVERMLGGGV